MIPASTVTLRGSTLTLPASTTTLVSVSTSVIADSTVTEAGATTTIAATTVFITSATVSIIPASTVTNSGQIITVAETTQLLTVTSIVTVPETTSTSTIVGAPPNGALGGNGAGSGSGSGSPGGSGSGSGGGGGSGHGGNGAAGNAGNAANAGTITASGGSVPVSLNTGGSPVTVSGGTATGTATATVSTLPTLSICSKRIRNPTYTAPGPIPTDYTWGCAPGFLCKPPKEDGCEIEAGLPDPGYYCSPDECEPVVPLNPPQSWGAPVTSNATAKYVLQDDYFNLGPQNFSLGYGIFVTQSSVVVDQQGGAATTDVPGAKTKRSYADLTVRVARVARAVMAGDQSRLSKRAETAPPACYDDCSKSMRSVPDPRR